MTPTVRWWVWDPINETEQEGRSSGAPTAEEAAEEYAQRDLDNEQGQLYEYGHPLLVRDMRDRRIYECSVRIEMLPTFQTHVVKR